MDSSVDRSSSWSAVGARAALWLVRSGRAAALTGALLLASAAQAATLLAPVDFSASQSMWSSGAGSLDFGAKGRAGFDPLWIDYDFGASTGTVAAHFAGQLRVDYDPALGSPGMTDVHLGFLGAPAGGTLSTYLGAWARLKLAGISVLNEDYVLDPAVAFRPRIGTGVAASDAFAAAEAGLKLILVNAGFELDIEQNDAFVATGLSGTLAYGRRGSGVVQEIPFEMSSDAGTTLALALVEPGDWDFQLRDVTLENSFALDFDIGLVAYEEHIAGLEFCRACFWGICIPYPCGIKYDRNDYELFGINVYRGTPFPLSFNQISQAGEFSVAVAVDDVPEPSALVLLGGALAILARSRARRAAVRT